MIIRWTVGCICHKAQTSWIRRVVALAHPSSVAHTSAAQSKFKWVEAPPVPVWACTGGLVLKRTTGRQAIINARTKAMQTAISTILWRGCLRGCGCCCRSCGLRGRGSRCGSGCARGSLTCCRRGRCCGRWRGCTSCRSCRCW